MTTSVSNSSLKSINRHKGCLDLILQLTSVDEKKYNVEELLNKSVQLIRSHWAEKKCSEVIIKYGEICIPSDLRSDIPSLESKSTSVREDHPISLTLICKNESTFDDEDQAFIDSITKLLASKIDRILTRNELSSKQEFLDKAYKLARIGTWEYDMNSGKLYWSDITKEVHGFGPDHEPDIEQTIQLFKEGFNRDTFIKTVDQALNHEKPFDVELKIISGKGDERWIRATGEPEYEDGVCVRFYGISQNVTNRLQAREDLQLRERRFRALVQDGTDMIAILDEETIFKYVSPTSLKVLGYAPESLINKSALLLIHNEDRDRALNHLLNLGYKEQVSIEPFRFADVNGNWRWLETTLTNLTEDPAVRGYVANSRDITEQYLRQLKLEGSLKKKEILLSEVHHRIKNNLSGLTGLLQLQSLKENNEEVVERLADSVTRIHAMASMHEQLYQSQNYSKLELADRIKLLVLNIQNTLQLKTDVQIQFDCDPVKVHVNRALPFSLILNEVVTNIFKHAFKGKNQGEISISLKKTDDKTICLKVKDNGVGIPVHVLKDDKDTLGMSLIQSLTDQLDGSFNYSNKSDGTIFNLNFKQA